jgi:hypothetical protein
MRTPRPTGSKGSRGQVREFYVMQGEIYTDQAFGQHGSQEFSVEKLLAEHPEYFVFNGSMGALSKLHPLQTKVGLTPGAAREREGSASRRQGSNRRIGAPGPL